MVHTYVLSAYSVLSYVYPTCLSLATSVIRAIYSVPTVVTRKRKAEAERFRYFRGEINKQDARVRLPLSAM